MVPRTSLAEVPHRVQQALDGRPGTRWVGVDGLGAAGKTTLAARLVEALPGAVVLHVDDFARPDLATWERDRFVAEVLRPLLAGRAARYRPADLVTGVLGPALVVPPGVPLVVEGVSSTDVRLRVPWDVTIWLDVPEQERRRRIELRDPPELLERWRDDWWPAEEAYVRAQRPAERADLVVG